ncbi:hypothetical protein GmHk_18G052361 [Glycine max]|nr:hypothetical protein GmHk_18G052361 [Glycine max]
MALVKEFYSNIYDPEDGSPKQCKVQGKVIKFDTQVLNDFLEMSMVLQEGERYPTFSQFLHTYPDH